MPDITPDHAEEAMEAENDNAVPTRGYGMLPIVGLGGSAGGVEALRGFFTHTNPNLGVAFVVVMHLSAEHESVLAEILQRCTTMRVIQVRETVKVQANTVYVIPPGKSIQTLDGHLSLGDLPLERHRLVTVDIFFRTLADTHGPHAAAIVLSGADGDGAIGIKRIKERGGLTIVQDPEQAQVASMPRSAIATGMVDWTLPVALMSERVESYLSMERVVRLPPEAGPAPSDNRALTESDEAAFRDVLAFVRTRTGRDFTYYKRATVVRRVGRRMQVNNIADMEGYLDCLRTRPGEAGALLQDLLISVTNFFRDIECFAALKARIPLLFDGKTSADAVRVWVAGCATGEEAYSIAMLLTEYARTLDMPPATAVSGAPGEGRSALTMPAATSTLSLSMDASPVTLSGNGAAAISRRNSKGTMLTPEYFGKPGCGHPGGGYPCGQGSVPAPGPQAASSMPWNAGPASDGERWGVRRCRPCVGKNF